jgi:hypothetical protein
MNYILKFLWTGMAHKHSSMIGPTVGKNKVLKLENKTNRMSKYLLYEIMIYVNPSIQLISYTRTRIYSMAPN